MIAVTSHRPFKDCSPEIRRNQIRARESWEGQFDGIVYFGEEEKELDGKNVQFIVNVEQFPPIELMMKCASHLKDWVAIVNADIVVSQGLKVIQRELFTKGALCAMSRRFEFEREDVNSGRMIDNGLDLFCATPSVWKLAAMMVPKNYRLGHCLWDTWTLGFMCTHYYAWLWDFTECRVIFHPKHEDRRRPFKIDHQAGRAQVDAVRWPAVSRRLKIQAIADATGTKPEHF